jgi:hypothetical protein
MPSGHSRRNPLFLQRIGRLPCMHCIRCSCLPAAGHSWRGADPRVREHNRRLADRRRDMVQRLFRCKRTYSQAFPPPDSTLCPMHRGTSLRSWGTEESHLCRSAHSFPLRTPCHRTCPLVPVGSARVAGALDPAQRGMPLAPSEPAPATNSRIPHMRGQADQYGPVAHLPQIRRDSGRPVLRSDRG